MRSPVESSTAVGVVTIEEMRTRHLRAVRSIDAKVYANPWSLALYQQELSRPESRIYRVARIGGSIVGYGGVMIVGTDGHITSVATDPKWSRRGVAKRVMLSLARGAVLAECEALTLEVRVSNKAAQRMYSVFGFVPAGVRKKYYADNGEDAIIMWAVDVGEPDYLTRLREIEAAVDGETRWKAT